MQICFDMISDILIASISGELDHHSAVMAREEIDKTMEAFRSKNLILNFREVSFMDSSGIGVVTGRYKKVKETGGKVWIAGCSEYAERILGMAGIFTIMGKSGSVGDAVCGIQGEISEQTTMEVING